MRRRRRSCANGHPYTAENTRIVRQVRTMRTGEKKVFVSRRCRRCQVVNERLRSRRRRLNGKLLSYPQWLARQT